MGGRLQHSPPGRLILLATLLATALLSGCDSKPVAGPDADDNATATAEPRSDSPTETSTTSPPETPADSPPETPAETPPERPQIVSNSPIDSMPEGLLYRTALDAIDNGQLEPAIDAQQQLATHPTYAVLGTAIEAVLLAHDQQFDTAMQRAQEVSTVAVMQPESYMIAADVFRYQGRWNEAIGCLNNAVQLNPGLERAHRWLGILYYDIGAMQQASQHLRRVADIDPKDYRSLMLAARIHSEYQNFTEAAEDSQRALKRQPPQPIAQDLRLRLADSQRELRQFDEAMQTLEACSDSAAVWAARAAILEAQGDSEAALEACRQAWELQPDLRRAHLVGGRVLLSQSQAAEAVEHLQQAVAAEPSDHEARFLLGRALLLDGKAEQGKQEIERSTELKESFLKIAELHIEAIDHPQDVEIRLQLAELTEASGRPKVALMWYQAVLGLAPHNAQAKTAIERLEKFR